MLKLLKSKAAHLASGKSAEDRAHEFLIGKGLSPIARNYRCKQGELDLIMRDRQSLVIVEVRYRKSDVYGSALESITLSKQNRIIAATHYFLAATPDLSGSPLRFDVVGLSGNGDINWIKNAF